MLRLLAVLALASALSASTAGCFTCAEQLDVHLCRDEAGRCDLEGEVVADWNADLASVWPDLGRLVGHVERGGHAHADWTPEQAAAFWTFWNIPADREDKQVYLRDGEDLYHVRVLAC